MATLHIFNPSHEEALASGSPLYYPSVAARLLAADLAALPALWAKAGDVVVLEKESPFPQGLVAERDVTFVEFGKISREVLQQITEVSPWGWDPLVARRLKKAGIPEELLPTDEELAAIRALSSRRTAVELLSGLRDDLPGTVGESFWCETVEEVGKIHSRYGTVLCKSPWSGSGRGLFRCDSFGEKERLRVEAVLRRQGGIEVEPFYRRIRDFALEFRAVRGGGVTYEALSVFETSDSGAYTGGLVDSEERLLEYIMPVAGSYLWPRLKTACERRLSELLADSYAGPLGVDMMVVEVAGDSRLHPCVEINLRNTMGRVAAVLHGLSGATSQGIFTIRPLASPNAAFSRGIVLNPGGSAFEAVVFPPQTPTSSDVVETI